MKLNALIRTLLLGAALTSAGSLFANTVWLEQTDNDGELNGGEFLAHPTGANTFLTFCLEAHITVAIGQYYNYTIDSVAYAGSGTGGVSTISSPGVGDAISKGTAWLYEQFARGTLINTSGGGAGSYFTSSAAARDLDAGILQTAFWLLEDESVSNAYSANNFYVNLVADAFHYGTLAGAKADYTGSQVKVMNLWATSDGSDAQSQLIFVPDGGLTVVLLGLGLISLAAFRRKL